MWLCKQVSPETGLAFSSTKDLTGSYGLTKVQCEPVTFGGPGLGTLSMVRMAYRVAKLLGL